MEFASIFKGVDRNPWIRNDGQNCNIPNCSLVARTGSSVCIVLVLFSTTRRLILSWPISAQKGIIANIKVTIYVTTFCIPLTSKEGNSSRFSFSPQKRSSRFLRHLFLTDLLVLNTTSSMTMLLSEHSGLSYVRKNP